MGRGGRNMVVFAWILWGFILFSWMLWFLMFVGAFMAFGSGRKAEITIDPIGFIFSIVTFVFLCLYLFG